MTNVEFKTILRQLMELPDEEMEKVKDLFILFGSESSQATLKLLAKAKLDGDEWVQYNDITKTLLQSESKYSIPRVTTNIRRMYHMGIILRVRNGKYVKYSIAPCFENICYIFFWMLGEKLIPSRYDDRLRIIVDMHKTNFQKLKKAFFLFGSASTQQVIKTMAAEYIAGEEMIWRNYLVQNLMDIGFDQPRVSANLSKLTKEGILKREKQGKHAYYGFSQKLKDISQVFPIIIPLFPQVGNRDRKNKRKLKP